MRPAGGLNIAKVALFLLFAILSFLFVFPLFCLVLGSLKPSSELLRFGLNLKLSPEILSLDNYTYLFNGGSIYFQWFSNSLILVVISTVLTLLFSSMVGYGLAVYDFKGKISCS